MPNDDYFKIVYQILSYLYESMKAGVEISEEAYSAEMYKIPQTYWDSIIRELIENGYVKGIKVRKYAAGAVFEHLNEAEITSMGVEYLQENKQMKKVYRFLKGIKEIIPGI
jgi:hypothetical protein